MLPLQTQTDAQVTPTQENSYAEGIKAPDRRPSLKPPAPTPCHLAGWWAPRADLRAAWQLLVGSWGNVLLVCLPLGYAAHAAHWNAVATFVLVRLSC